MEHAHFAAPFFFFFPFMFMIMALVLIAFFVWFSRTRQASTDGTNMAGAWPMSPWAVMERFQNAREQASPMVRARPTGEPQPTGNAAFDAYRQETLDKLDEDAKAFADYRDRLRKALDREEFDRFLDDMKRTDGGSSQTAKE